MQHGFYFDNSRCTGCRTCAIACADYKNITGPRLLRRIIDYEGGSWTREPNNTLSQDCFSYHISLACNHCNNPACVQVCPTGAMHRDEKGLVWPDWGKCIGCGYCAVACPYHAPFIDDTIKKSNKCDGCKDRLAEGKQALCVEACPLRALDFGEISHLKAVHTEDLLFSIPPLADETYTSPNMLIKASPAATKAHELGGHISNRREIFGEE